jgi:thiol reductant ABC exporter CydC subunit
VTWLWPASGHGRQLGLAAALSALTYGCGIALMGCAAWLISRAAEHPNASSLALAAVGVRALGVGRGVARYAERLVGHDATLRVVADLRVRVFQSLVPRRDDLGRDGDILSRVVTDVEAVQDLWLRCLIPFASALLVSAGCVLGLLWWSTPAALLLLAGLVVAGIALPLTGAALARGDRGVAAMRGDYGVKALDVLHGCADLLVLGGLPAALLAAQESADDLAGKDRAAGRRAAALGLATAVVQGATALGVAAIALAAVQHGRLDRTLLAVLVLVALASFEPVAPLLEAAALVPVSLGALQRLGSHATSPPAAQHPIASARSVELQGVQVHYPGARKPALSDVDLDLQPGRSLALVGPSGAGKTTLLKVLTGALLPDAGSARLGSRSIASCSEAELAKYVVLAEQEAYLFATTVRDNLLLARPEARPEDLRQALEVAGLTTWLDGLPRGLDTMVGEHGAQVSGGERKRLSLARAVLSEAPFLLLDEPTEGLDPVAGVALVRRVLATSSHRSVLLVTHRTSLLDLVDEVVALDAGRVLGSSGGRQQDVVPYRLHEAEDSLRA